MSVPEPRVASAPTPPDKNIGQGRWRYWYSSIADLMIAEPGITHVEIASRLKKHPTYIGAIVGTDLFREYFSKRREEFTKDHDFAVRAKMTGLALTGLDIMLDELKAKRGTIPLRTLDQITTGALDRLGYAPASEPTVVVDQSHHTTQQVLVAGVTTAELEAARQAIRQVERMNAGKSLPSAVRDHPMLEADEAEPIEVHASQEVIPE